VRCDVCNTQLPVESKSVAGYKEQLEKERELSRKLATAISNFLRLSEVVSSIDFMKERHSRFEAMVTSYAEYEKSGGERE